MRIKYNWDRDELEKLYWQEKKTLAQIASMFGVNRQAVCRCMKRQGIPRRSCSEAQVNRHGLNYNINWSKEQLEKLYLEGKSATDISHIYHCSKWRVYKSLKQFGIPIRTQHEAKKVFYETHEMPEALRRKHKGSYKTTSGYIIVRAPDHPMLIPQH